MIFILLLLQSTALPSFDDVRYNDCTALAAKDPASGIVDATAWKQEQDHYLAAACLGLAYARDQQFDQAATHFAAAGGKADAEKDPRAPRFWAQAGNAAIASGNGVTAVVLMNKALDNPIVVGAERGEMLIDRARAKVAFDDPNGAVTDLADARKLAPENPTAWLLSATLSRRMNVLAGALSFIETAAKLAPRNPAVALEAGNIAAAAGDDAAAKRQWEQVLAIAPNSKAAATARTQLAVLADGQPPAGDGR